MLICGFGCAALGELVPQIVPVAKYIGAAYVLYLAYKTLIRKTGSGTADASRPLTCGNGLLLQFLNVKILMLGVTFYSGYILPYGFHPGRIVAFALVMALLSYHWHEVLSQEMGRQNSNHQHLNKKYPQPA